jgi:surfactin synthase thioesterase subunit
MQLPVLQADFRVIETWQPGLRPGSAAAGSRTAQAWQLGSAQTSAADGSGTPGDLWPLPCPVAALGATADRRCTPTQLEAWREVAPAGAFELHWFEGGHR